VSVAALAAATSAEAFGGMEGLVAAAKAEGKLNVIALPPDWANYGEIIKGFQAKYPEIKITSDQPDASSADEIATAERSRARPAPRRVRPRRRRRPGQHRQVRGLQGGHLGRHPGRPQGRQRPVGQRLRRLHEHRLRLGQGAGPDHRRRPAEGRLQGQGRAQRQPDQAGAAFAGVQMVSIAPGRHAADITKGVDFFKQLKAAGNFLPVDPNEASVLSGQTPVVIDWAYNNAPLTKKLPTWKTWIPDNAVLAGYYIQAINADAPHPAAARLWQEYLYSDEGQNLWLKGGARPVRYDAMKAAGKIDAAAQAALPAHRRQGRHPDPGRQRRREGLPRRQLDRSRWLIVRP
jgi:putative spermidine/putrescine transport system substrate-binding protein